jgi:hypothetical protein
MKNTSTWKIESAKAISSFYAQVLKRQYFYNYYLLSRIVDVAFLCCSHLRFDEVIEVLEKSSERLVTDFVPSFSLSIKDEATIRIGRRNKQS